MKLICFSPFVSLVLMPVLAVAPLWGQTPVAQPDSSSSSSLVQGLQLRLIESDGPQSAISSKSVKGFTVEVTDLAGNAISDAAVAFRLPDTGVSGTFADGTRSAVSYTDSLGRAHVNGPQWSATPGPMAIRVTATKGTAHAGILIDQTLASEPLTMAKRSRAPLPAVPVEQPTLPSVVVQPSASPAATPATPVLVAKGGPLPQQPGTLAKPSGPLGPVPAQEPAVSVTAGSPQASSHSGRTKWIIIAVVAVGAGAGAALAMKGKSSTSSTPAPSGISIGNPVISVGSGH